MIFLRYSPLVDGACACMCLLFGAMLFVRSLIVIVVHKIVFIVVVVGYIGCCLCSAQASNESVV